MSWGPQDGQRLLAATVEALASTLGLRDGDTGVHCGRVADLACRVGYRFGLTGQSLKDLGYAAQLHDIGKVGVPDSVLRKPAPLSAEERQLIREHAVWGAELIGRIPGLERVAEIVRHHHERYDGGGYPDGLSSKSIPLESRILAVADAFLAMVEDRPYRPALSRARAEEELRSARGAQFDPEVVDAVREEAEARTG